jgi:hypothetical protein
MQKQAKEEKLMLAAKAPLQQHLNKMQELYMSKVQSSRREVKPTSEFKTP